MSNAENIIKSHLDGTFMKFAGTYSEGKWPFKLIAVEPDYIPNYGRKTFTEMAQEDGRKSQLRLKSPRRGGGPKLRLPTEDELKLIRQHAADGIKQDYTRALLNCGSETWARFRIAAGFRPRKWEAL